VLPPCVVLSCCCGGFVVGVVRPQLRAFFFVVEALDDSLYIKGGKFFFTMKLLIIFISYMDNLNRNLTKKINLKFFKLKRPN
jgi:hypothetical protein